MSKPISNLEFSFLGSIDFQEAFSIQRNLWKSAKIKNQVSIMGLEHPTVITLGRRTVNESLMNFDIPVIQSTRGGLTTIHSEGQLVVYPIVNLKHFNWGVKTYVDILLQITQKTFEDFEIKTYIDDQRIGLFTEEGKIAFCGLEIKEGVSQHGISINVANDLNLFNQIISCGVSSMPMDRVQNYRWDVSTEMFFNLWIENWDKIVSEKQKSHEN